MNTPNKLTVFRMFLVPVFLVLLLAVPAPWCFYSGVVVFIIASLTDLIDGKLARKNNQVTDFGKFLDPLADKLLVICALIGLQDKGLVPSFIVVIIIARELMVTSLRLVASGAGNVIAAGWWGKVKTTVQMIAIIVLMVEPPLLGNWEKANIPFLTGADGMTTAVLGTVLIYAAAVLTIISGVEYFVKNYKYIDPTR